MKYIIPLSLLAFAALLLPMILKFPTTIVYNASESQPIGFYMVSSSQPKRGDIVLATLADYFKKFAADREYLPAHISLLKPIAAAEGDKVCRIGEVISINDQTVGTALIADSKGRPMPQWDGCIRLSAREVFLFSNHHPSSFDGRYFGAIDRKYIQTTLSSLWIRD